MINLIPAEERINLTRAYQKRFYIVLLSFTAAAFIIGGVLLIPPYRLSKEKTAAARHSADIIRLLASSKEESNPEFAVKEILKQLDLFAAKTSDKSPSRLTGNILRDRPAGVKVIGLSYDEGGKAGVNIEIRGVSLDRETLLNFVRALEREDSFAKVTVPVSSFVSDRDLGFAIQVSVKSEKL